MAFPFDLVFWIYTRVLFPIYANVLRPLFLWIDTGLGWVSWLYRFRATLMVQGLVFYWRGSIYFKRCTLWEKIKQEHPEKAEFYLDPIFWSIDLSFVIVAIVLVIVASLLGEKNVRKFFNVKGKIGVNFYRLGKSMGEFGMLRLMVFIGDQTSDPSKAEREIASFFVCFYLSSASLLKLCHIGNDLGFVDGIAAVIVSMITHYCKFESHRVLGFFGAGLIIWAKNIFFSECCAPCSRQSQVDEDSLPTNSAGYGGGCRDGRDGNRGGRDGNRGGRGGRGGNGGGRDGNRGGRDGNGRGRGVTRVQRRRGSASQSVDFSSIDVNEDEDYFSTRSSAEI